MLMQAAAAAATALTSSASGFHQHESALLQLPAVCAELSQVRPVLRALLHAVLFQRVALACTVGGGPDGGVDSPTTPGGASRTESSLTGSGRSLAPAGHGIKEECISLASPPSAASGKRASLTGLATGADEGSDPESASIGEIMQRSTQPPEGAITLTMLADPELERRIRSAIATFLAALGDPASPTSRATHHRVGGV